MLARNLIPVVGIYGFGWSAALAVFNYWFDGLTAIAAIVAALIPRALRETQQKSDGATWVGALSAASSSGFSSSALSLCRTSDFSLPKDNLISFRYTIGARLNRNFTVVATYAVGDIQRNLDYAQELSIFATVKF